MALEALYGIKTGMNTEKLYDLCAFVQKVSGARTQPWKAIVGDRLWAEGAAAAGNLIQLKRDEKDFFEAGTETWNPKVVGLTHQVYFGKDSLTVFPSGTPNPAVIQGFLTHLGLGADPKVVDGIMKAMLEEIERRGAAGRDRWLTEEEVTELCWKLAG
jgi:isopropylmalate/homocitrate/citramalate synthase